jgi:hypothetical protein
MRKPFAFVLTCALLSACGGSGTTVTPDTPSLRRAQTSTPIVLRPDTLSLKAGESAKVTVSEPKYTGHIYVRNGTPSCSHVAIFAPSKARGPKFKLTVGGVADGACVITLRDANEHSTALHVTVGKTSPSPTPSPTSAPTATPTPANQAALPLDDTSYETTGPEVGHVYSCQGTFGGGGSNVDGPWIDAANNTWNSLTKLAVEGSVSWTPSFTNNVSGPNRVIQSNGLPSHTTGTYPIQVSDPAHQYDQNPNSIAAQSVTDQIPANPTVAATPTCLNMGAIGVMLTGAALYNALDGGGRDAAAHEELDSCNGHPDQSGVYHYHAYSACFSDPGSGHSALLGYAADGFGIYGLRGEDGTVLTDGDLDACHGHTHSIAWNGATVVMYHYHFTYEYPYSLGCFMGTPSTAWSPLLRRLPFPTRLKR